MPARVTARLTGMRYLGVAGTCLLAHSVIMIVADAGGLALVPAMLLSFALTGLLGFGLHSRFTFAVTPGWRALGRYYLAMAPNLPLATALLWLLTDGLRLPMPIAAPAGACLMTAFNFLTARWAIVPPPARPA